MNDWQYEPAHDQALTPTEKLKSLRRESGLAFSTTQMLWRIGVYAYLKTYHGLRVIGRDNIPAKPPFVMIANHTSHLDALVLGTALPWPLRRKAFPIAAGDVFFETPQASLFSAMTLNALPMWRKHCGPHALQELRERLVGEPAIYLLFPEGQRSRDGSLGPFKPGLGMMIAGSEVPVVPCHLDGAFAACPPGTKWPRPKRLTLRVGPPVAFPDVTNRRAGWEEIAARLEAAVKLLSGGRPGKNQEVSAPSEEGPSTSGS